MPSYRLSTTPVSPASQGRRTNIAEIHGHVASSGKSAIVAIWLLQKQRRFRVRAWSIAKANEQDGAYRRKATSAFGPRSRRFCQSLHYDLMTKSLVGLPWLGGKSECAEARSPFSYKRISPSTSLP